MTETTAPKLTYAEKLQSSISALYTRISADTGKYNALTAELANLQAIESLNTGDSVTVKTGRKFSDKDTTKVRPGVVLGVKVDENGKRSFKVQVGAGFEADIVVVDSSAITVTASEDAAAAAVTSDTVA